MKTNKELQMLEENTIFSSVIPVLQKYYPNSSPLLEHTDKPDKIIVVNNKKIGVEITQIDSESHLAYFNPIHRSEKEFRKSIDEDTPSTLIKKNFFYPEKELKTILKNIFKKSQLYKKYKKGSVLQDCVLIIYSQRFGIKNECFNAMFSHLERILKKKNCPFRYIFFCSSGLYKNDGCSLVYDRYRFLRKKSDKGFGVPIVEGKVFAKFGDCINLDELSANQPISSNRKK